MVVVALALAAAFSFAVGVVLQQHAAAAQPIEHHLRPSLVIRLCKRPLWLAGVAAGALGTAVQLLALWHGTLVEVQPLLVCGLLFALPINAIWMHRRRLATKEIVAAATVCIGLAIFLLATDPRAGHGSATPAGWFVALGSIAVAVVVLIACAVASQGAVRSGLLACSAGVINGLSAAFTKGVAHGLSTHWHQGIVPAVASAFSNWELYAFAATLLVVTLIVQSAFQAGPIRWSLPALTAANPVTSVIIGATVLGEQVRSSDLALSGAVLGLALVVVGILTLSSSTLITGGTEEQVLVLPGSVIGALEIVGPIAVAPIAVAPIAVDAVGTAPGINAAMERDPSTALAAGEGD